MKRLVAHVLLVLCAAIGCSGPGTDKSAPDAVADAFELLGDAAETFDTPAPKDTPAAEVVAGRHPALDTALAFLDKSEAAGRPYVADLFVEPLAGGTFLVPYQGDSVYSLETESWLLYVNL